MDQYFKTDLGIQALKQRSFQLNARQRQLLLLIGTDDFKILNSALKQRLATPELIQQLEELGLIFQDNAPSAGKKNNTALSAVTTSIALDTNQQPTLAQTTKSQSSKVDIISSISISEKLTEVSSPDNLHTNEPTHDLKPQLETPAQKENKLEHVHISFDEIKQKMAHLLQTHCGLMTKQLVIQIQQAKSIRDIKFCQMQWITALQESRISPLELNQTMQQINYSLQHLQSS
ncbi:hypothetical protein [Acinetobacter bereziniae]|uniref:hypothetical protein n=1 Tax=Acinetobacter bereziniae TaxID=106648 RepID=UPI000575D618|nr:hypothetical protein [Acinetobacter bereziniae]CEI51621.1 hypothetical protein [Acinetobacter bereziniae]